MPPCESVLLNKIRRTQSATRMIKSCGTNLVYLPKVNDGYCFNESNAFMIEYFPGCPYPENIANLIKDNSITNSNNDDETNYDLSDSDDEYNEDINDDWN